MEKSKRVTLLPSHLLPNGYMEKVVVLDRAKNWSFLVSRMLYIAQRVPGKRINISKVLTRRKVGSYPRVTLPSKRVNLYLGLSWPAIEPTF